MKSLLARIDNMSKHQSKWGMVAKTVNNTLGRTSYRFTPLSEPYPGVPSIPDTNYESIQTQMSTLPNGVRVVSRNTQDPICNVGLYVNAGSRYCSSEVSGVGHFLESLSPNGTNNIAGLRWAENMARTGSSLMVQAFRDAMLYQIETFPKNADFALESIAELIWNSPYDYAILKSMQKEYLWRRGDVMKDAESEIPEYMHQAAYQGNTLGLPLYCDHHTVKNMTKDVISEFINVFYQPTRMIVIGVGLEHSKLETIAKQAFGDIKSDPNFANLESPKAQYTGGQLKMKYDFKENSDSHVGLIFQTENWKSKDLMALCVLNMIMGGGGSFSAGGPGKGMYTRLYREVLGSHHWISHISSSHSIFDDSGIFCFYGCSSSENAGALTGVMVHAALDMVNRPPTKQELDRAKISLASNICFEFENRQIVFEDLGRQVNVFGTHKTPDLWYEEIMKVSKDDIVNVASKLLSSRPTLLALGADISKVPTIHEVEEAIQSAH